LLCDYSGEVLDKTIRMLKNNKKISSQNSENSSKAPKIKKKDFLINWNDSAFNIHNKIRALSYVGAYSFYNNKRIKFFNSYYTNNIGEELETLTSFHTSFNGCFLFFKNKLYVKAESSLVIIDEIQIEGKKRINVKQMSDYNYFNKKRNFENEYFK